MKRRDFIATTIATGSALSLHHYMAKATPVRNSKVQSADDFLEDDSIMIIIDLFGGNDGLNTVIPLQQDEYYNLRPNIAL
ncbi:MAG: twin-arginine translocation pathway signal protein, partial [Candidatus Kapaibacterium sp.]